MRFSIKVEVEIRAIELIAAVGADNLAVLLVHFRAAAVANKDAFLRFGRLLLGIG